MHVNHVRSSLVYQILLHVNKLFSLAFFAFMLILYLYKELVILLLFAPTEFLRISWGETRSERTFLAGTRGNLTETPAYIAFSLLLSLAALGVCVYFAIFQNYVLLIEEILIGVETLLIVLETVLGIALFASLSRFARSLEAGPFRPSALA